MLAMRAQNASIGSVILGETLHPIRYTQIVIPSNTLEFNPLSLTILSTEELKEWADIFKWQTELAVNGNDFNNELLETMELTVLNLQNQPVMTVRYKNVWPTVLGDVNYSLVDDETTVSFDVTFRYTHFDITIISTGEVISYAS